MIVCIENPKQQTEELRKLVSDYNKVAGYTANIQKSIAFLYTNNEQAEFENKNTIPFTLAPKKNK